MATDRLYRVTVNNTANYYILINPDHIAGVRTHLSELASAAEATAEVREVHLSNLDEIAANHFANPGKADTSATGPGAPEGTPSAPEFGAPEPF